MNLLSGQRTALTLKFVLSFAHTDDNASIIGGPLIRVKYSSKPGRDQLNKAKLMRVCFPSKSLRDISGIYSVESELRIHHTL